MIPFWNRKEVYFGFSLQKYNEVRQTFAANGIPYAHRLVNNHHSAKRTGSFGENRDFSITYYVYVHKKDVDRAGAVLNHA